MLIDVLGHPIRKGDKVLTGNHYSTGMDIVAQVDKVTKKAVYVTLEATKWDYDMRKKYVEHTSVRRQPYQVVVIDKQLAYNKKHYPENFI